LSAALRQNGFGDAPIVTLNELDHAVLKRPAGDRPPTVIAAGGDGTAAAVANIVDSQTPMLPYPLGTENLLARYLGIKADPGMICNLLRSSRTEQCDAGSASGRLFLLMASCGFDAEVVRRMAATRRGNINHLSYLPPISEALLTYRFPTIRVTLKDAASPDKVLTGKWAFVVNLPRYAGGLRIAPQASGADGLLDVRVFKRGSLLHNLAYLGGVAIGAHETWPDCEAATRTTMRIEADEPVPYQLDGDFGGYLPIDIKVLAGRVRLVVPRDGEWRVK
jgi:diacylglycerol kinase family enzyme